MPAAHTPIRHPLPTSMLSRPRRHHHHRHALPIVAHPSLIGDRYFYQQLLLKVPFRTSSPSDFISDTNISGTLREECSLRGIIPSEADGGLAALVQEDAKKRLFTQEQIDTFLKLLHQQEVFSLIYKQMNSPLLLSPPISQRALIPALPTMTLPLLMIHFMVGCDGWRGPVRRCCSARCC